MKVLILGANGMLGPHVVKALEGRHELRLTDINDLDSPPRILQGRRRRYRSGRIGR